MMKPDAETLCWSTGRTKTTATWSPVSDQSWSSFVEWLSPDTPASTKEVSPYVGGTLRNGTRDRQNVEQRFFLTLDVDYADPEFPLDAELVLDETPFVIHTTWRHLEDGENHRYRLVIPLDRGVTPNEYKELAWRMMDKLGGEQFDKTTAQAERFMWGPSTQDPDAYFYRSANPQARYLPVDAWLDGQHSVSDGRAGAPGTSATPTPPATVGGPHNHGSEEPTEEDHERALEILEQTCEDIENLHEVGEFSGRNEAVFHLLPLFLRFVNAGVLDEDLVLDSLWRAAQRVPSDEPYSKVEFEASVKSARQYAEQSGPVLPETAPTRSALADFADVDVSDADLWARTERLRYVAQMADSMGRNRLALLSMMLIRILGEVPSGILLPGAEDGGIFDRAPIHLGLALIGSSGQGKTMLAQESERILSIDQSKVSGVVSTGQGMIQHYMQDDDEGGQKLKNDPRGIFITDEIDKLGALGADAGSTVMSEVRTMLTGSMTGTSNATKERQRMLHAKTYNFQLVVNVQPSRAEPLLSGREAGTPQRFIWVSVTDPATALPPVERPERPGPLDWDLDFLFPLELEQRQDSRGEAIVQYPEWVKDELKMYDYKVSMEGPEGGETSKFGHLHLLRLKVAAGIAFLHESTVIEDLHLEIADQIIESSKRVQTACERAVWESSFQKRKAAISSEARARDEIDEDKLGRLLKNAREAVVKADGEWVKWVTLRPRYALRAAFQEPLWEALENQEDLDTVEEERGSTIRRKVRAKS